MRLLQAERRQPSQRPRHWFVIASEVSLLEANERGNLMSFCSNSSYRLLKAIAFVFVGYAPFGCEAVLISTISFLLRKRNPTFHLLRPARMKGGINDALATAPYYHPEQTGLDDQSSAIIHSARPAPTFRHHSSANAGVGFRLISGRVVCMKNPLNPTWFLVS